MKHRISAGWYLFPPSRFFETVGIEIHLPGDLNECAVVHDLDARIGLGRVETQSHPLTDQGGVHLEQLCAQRHGTVDSGYEANVLDLRAADSRIQRANNSRNTLEKTRDLKQHSLLSATLIIQ